jgi:hypothetical protein
MRLAVPGRKGAHHAAVAFPDGRVAGPDARLPAFQDGAANEGLVLGLERAWGPGRRDDRRPPRPPAHLWPRRGQAGRRRMLHSLSLSFVGSVSAWGWNGVGQLGDGTIDHSRPAPVRGLDALVDFVAAGAHHSLAIRNEGPLAWGWNAVGQLGDGTTIDRATPVVVPVPRAGRMTALVGGVFHSLATVADGKVWGWGSNGVGQLGVGSTQVQPAALPIRVGALQAPLVVSGGYAHTVVG